MPADSTGVDAVVSCETDDLDTYDVNERSYVLHSGPYTLIVAQHSGELRDPHPQAVVHVTV